MWANLPWQQLSWIMSHPGRADPDSDIPEGWKWVCNIKYCVVKLESDQVSKLVLAYIICSIFFVQMLRCRSCCYFHYHQSINQSILFLIKRYIINALSAVQWSTHISLNTYVYIYSEIQHTYKHSYNSDIIIYHIHNSWDSKMMKYSLSLD